MEFNYSQNADGTHIFYVMRGDDADCFNSRILTDNINEIYQNAQGTPIYIVLNLASQEHLPLHAFILDLKRFYTSINQSSVFVALVLPHTLVHIVEATIKTLISRRAIQNFEQEKTALLWLNIERQRLQAN